MSTETHAPQQFAPNAATLLKSFVEAGNALELLPKVQADLEASQQLAAETEDKLNTERAASARLAANLTALRADLAQREAELAQTIKSRADLEAIVNLIRGALPVASVEPRTDAESQPMPASDNALTDDEHTATTKMETETVARPTSLSDQPPSTLYPAPTRVIPGAMTYADPAPADGSPASSYGLSVDRDPTPKPETGSESNTPLPPEPSASGDSHGQTPHVRHFDEPRPSWQKPSTMTWHDWVNLGNVAPAWITDLHHT